MTAWHTVPAVRAILRNMAASPPPQKYDRPAGCHPGGMRYVSTVGPNADRRVGELRAIHKAECARLYDRGDYDAWQACCEFDEQAAIRAALQSGKRKVAA